MADILVQIEEQIVEVKLSNATMKDLVQSLEKIYPEGKGYNWQFSYQDAEGDSIKVESDIELRAYLEHLPSVVLFVENEGVLMANHRSLSQKNPISNAETLNILQNIFENSGIIPTSCNEEKNNNGETVVYVDCNVPSLPPHFMSEVPVSISAAELKQAKEISKNPFPHYAFCDNCNETIFGIRYKCINCADYDLCERCEANWRNENLHNLNHYFLKIHNDLPKDWASQIASPFPHARMQCRERRRQCKEQMEKRLVSLEQRIQNLELQANNKLEKTPFSSSTTSSSSSSNSVVPPPVPISTFVPEIASERKKLEYVARKKAEFVVAHAKRVNEERARQEAELERMREMERAENEKREAEERARQEAEELKARQEAELKARQAAELKARQEAEERMKALIARREAEERAIRETAELKARQEAELRARQEAELKAQEEMKRKAFEIARAQEEARRIERLRQLELVESSQREAEARRMEEYHRRTSSILRPVSTTFTPSVPISPSPVPSSLPVPAPPMKTREEKHYETLRQFFSKELQQLRTMGFAVTEKQLIDLLDKHRDVSKVIFSLLGAPEE